MTQKRIAGVLPALVLTLFLAACSGGTTVPESSLPSGVAIALKNPSFNTDAQGQVSDWTAVEHNRGKSYTFVADTVQPHSAPTSARIQRYGTEDYGMLEQQIRVQPAWVGKTVRLSGYLKSAGVSGAGGALILQARDGSNNILANDHMNEYRVKGDQNWKQYAVQLKVPQSAWFLRIGVMLEEGGTLWADDIALELMD